MSKPKRSPEDRKGQQVMSEQEMATKISELRSLKHGWDSYSGVAISEEAIAAAVKLLMSKPQLTPRSDGGVQIDWPNGEISFDPGGVQEH